MKSNRKLFRVVKPFVSVMAIVITSIVLLSTIYFTDFNPQWVTFLTGILVASALAEATRRSYAEWLTVRRTAQLGALKYKYEHETQLRKIAEQTVADNKPMLHLIDEVLPTMIAFVDREGNCQYHNRAFMTYLKLRPDQISGSHMHKVLGTKVYQETATAVRQSLDGHAVRYTRTEVKEDGTVYKLSIQHLPQIDQNGKVSGFYMLINDITEPVDVRGTAQAETYDAQDMYVESFAEQITGQRDQDVIIRAIEDGHFNLFCQLITPLGANGNEHYEILLRLLEEEEGMMPPGMFFPLAEKYGLMPHLDRWVVQHVVQWVARQKGGSIPFINISEATICDPGFPEFLRLTLLEHGVLGNSLCFEIQDSDLASKTAEVVGFAQQVRRLGCRIALSGFGKNKVSFNLLRGIDVEFLKIDGSTILGVLADPVNLSKVTAIDKAAKKVGVKTVAEMVEDEATIAKLKDIGIDYAQGFGISRPRTLEG